jgi:uncharacterized membrane protein (UPF0127 family)
MLALFVLAACSARAATVPLQVAGHPLSVEVADTPESRATGLMRRDQLPADTGMVFVYPDVAVRGFWMKDTRIPLSIAFLDNSGTIVRLADMKPFDTSRTSSLYPARYAIEVNLGWFAARGVEVGDKVTGLEALPAGR